MSSNLPARGSRSRGQSLQQGAPKPPRKDAFFKNKPLPVTPDDAYSYALRSAYLSYLLQPRQKRLQQAPASALPKATHKGSAMELLMDFSGVTNARSNKFPHDFMRALEKAVTMALMGKSKMPEFANDHTLKRTIAVFLNDFKDPERRRNLERDRKMEDLLLFFYSSCVKELKKGMAQDDDAWKFLADRHLAMFIRLITSILKENDWEREKPELAQRLKTIEKKLLSHDQNLATSTSSGPNARMIEVHVPLSYEVKDMPLVQVVGRLFDRSTVKLQEDITKNKALWTEEAAVKDLKMYQQCISLEAKNTINADAFDTQEAYESWKKNETTEVSQLLFEIMQAHPELAKTTTGTALPPVLKRMSSPADNHYADLSRRMGEHVDSSAGQYGTDIDLSALNLDPTSSHDGIEFPFVFIPQDSRGHYCAVAKAAFLQDLRNPDPTDTIPEDQILQTKTTALLADLAARWRIPAFSRIVLFLQAFTDLYVDRDIGLETVDNALSHFKQIPQDRKKANRQSAHATDLIAHWTTWTLKDLETYQQSLRNIREHVLRDLFQILQAAYDAKSPKFGTAMVILQIHLGEDELLPTSNTEFAQFAENLTEALKERATETYQIILAKNIPTDEGQWEFFHVIQLGKEVVALCDKIQKRFKKAADIFGAKPLPILISEVLPSFGEDARDLVNRIIENSKHQNEEIPISDGFDLYRELVEIRRVYNSALPGQKFAFHVEDNLQQFVWRWIEATETSIPSWVEGAFQADDFQMGIHLGDDNRHSVSITDIFRSFKQSKDQISELGWDNEYQYAKFMTAIAKALSGGILRYCALVDQAFIKEMSKLTPEQEVQLRHTRQEKWMQIAKDAFTGKKVEPYQFMPESLVKLNNVEYAMLNLDKLEQEMDVDRCADIIKRHDAVNPPNGGLIKKKQEKFVFTIKIIEAEDLKACDINGLSDPYVVLGDEFQKRLAKTRIIYGNLNPRWDETVDIATNGPLNIVATIWDWDALGDHDCVGRTSLKLDPSHFRDYTPREYWLDLDTQGRLLLRVSMEGERDDIQFHFGKAFRSLKRTERDMTRTITDKLSAYIRYILSRQKLKTLLSRGITMSSALSYFNRARTNTNPSTIVTQEEIENAIAPLYAYFDENFAIMKQTLTESAMVQVMTRVWKEVLVTIEVLLVPPMSDKLSQQKPLTQQELDTVFKWLQLLFEFFHAIDEETGVAHGVPIDVLKSPKYHEILNLNFFYFESTEDLIRTSEGMAAASSIRHQEQVAKLNRLSAPPSLGGSSQSSHSFGGAAGFSGSMVRRRKTVMLSRNLGTMRQAKEEKRKAAQAEPTDEYILRILRMRPEAERYLRDRAKQKERLAAAQAAETIVRQSLAAVGGGRMVAGYSQFGR